MEITWYGHSCFRIVERGQLTVITDPFSEDIGLPLPKLKGEIVSVSHDVPGHNNVNAVRGAQQTIYRAGEYEIGNVFITGIALHYQKEAEVRHNIGYLFDYDGLNVLHLGDLGHIPEQSLIENIGIVHVLMIPVGGGNALKASEAAEVVGLFEPGYVVPMHYALPGLNVALDGVDKFLKAMGVSKVNEAETLKVSASELPEQPQVVVLAPQALSRDTES
ncbi:MAG: MBL fold metallo-hydrolase [Chloroflexota bacterium]|nr:MBL fold metallo-hydrolase [Chloroflexota bacterium]